MGFLTDFFSTLGEELAVSKEVRDAKIILDMEYEDDDYNVSGNYRDVALRNTPSNRGWYKCPRCGRNFRASQMDADHIVPKSKNGYNDTYNMQLLCAHCNRSKGDDTSQTEEDLRRRRAEIEELRRQDKEMLEQLIREERNNKK